MSKKRTSAESNDDGETNEASNSFQNEDSAKRAKLDQMNYTTLQDLPIEMLERICFEAIVMEVRGLKMAKRVWKAKADLVMNRLQTVCSQWDNILTTNFFRNKVYRALEAIAEEPIRLEILQQSPIRSLALQVAIIKDEIFVMRRSSCDRPEKSLVYDRNDAKNVKDVIAQPVTHPVEIVGCSISSCVYVLNVESNGLSILRITKEADHQFNISPWITDLRKPISTMSVSPNGNLVILSRDLLSFDLFSINPLSMERISREINSRDPQLMAEPLLEERMRRKSALELLLLRELESEQRRPRPSRIEIYNSSGFMQQDIKLSPDILRMRNAFSIIQIANGNLVLASSTNRFQQLLILEIDRTGIILHQYQSALCGHSDFSFEFIGGRILMSDYHSKFELLDSELNPLDISSQLQLFDGKFSFGSKLHFNRERNEIVRVGFLSNATTAVLATLRLTEEC